VEEYSRLCEVELSSFTRELLANYPAIITVGERIYPRGFLQILDDGSLRCACAIDEGVVFRVAAQVDYIQQLKTALERIHHDLGQQIMILGFECAARRQLVEQQSLKKQIPPLFAGANIWGFSCMGEQSNSLNMNNSFNALAFKLPS
jgi:hypothetical protein